MVSLPTPKSTNVDFQAFADILVMLLFTIAVLEIPYTRSSEVLAKLQKDGGWYFLALFLIHITTIIVLTRGKVGSRECCRIHKSNIFADVLSSNIAVSINTFFWRGYGSSTRVQCQIGLVLGHDSHRANLS